MRISDWSSDVCSSYLLDGAHRCRSRLKFSRSKEVCHQRHVSHRGAPALSVSDPEPYDTPVTFGLPQGHQIIGKRHVVGNVRRNSRSEEHTTDLQSLMRISYAVFRLNKQTTADPTSKLQPTNR